MGAMQCGKPSSGLDGSHHPLFRFYRATGLSRIENGHVEPTFRRAVRFCEAFDLSLVGTLGSWRQLREPFLDQRGKRQHGDSGAAQPGASTIRVPGPLSTLLFGRFPLVLLRVPHREGVL
jgi:hypothetical protein